MTAEHENCDDSMEACWASPFVCSADR